MFINVLIVMVLLLCLAFELLLFFIVSKVFPGETKEILSFIPEEKMETGVFRASQKDILEETERRDFEQISERIWNGD